MNPALQTESSECGLACLAMIASHFGHHTDLADLRRQFSISLKGATLAQLMRHASAMHLNSRPLRLELDEMADLALPCILHWNLNHFVVLKQVKKDLRGRITLILLDPVQCLLLFYIGAGLLMENALTVGMLMAFSSYTGTFTGRISNLIGLFVSYKMLMSMHSERLADIVIDVSKTPFAPNELPQHLASTILSNAQQNILGSNSNEALYRIKVQLKQQSINAYGKAQAIKPGMTLEADVVQDKRKIWEWIIEPVLAVTRSAAP